MSDIKLDRKERLILATQFRILAAIEPENRKDHEACLRILENGFEKDYDELATMMGIDPQTTPESACREVYDILDMFRSLRDSYERLDDKTGINEQDIRFFGFDGNNETDYLSYGRYLNEQGKYKESEVVNSHMPSLEVYRRMLQEYEPVKANRPLKKADIERIAAAVVHPSRRNK